MEANGYRTLKELHNGEFFVHDYIFVSNELYKSLRGRGIVDNDNNQPPPPLQRVKRVALRRHRETIDA